MCDARAHGQAIVKFQEKIGASRQRIKEGLIEGTRKYLSTCSSAPAFLRKGCCAAIKNVAVEQCKQKVRQEALMDNECAFDRRNCGIICKKEKIRSQCCTWLAPQVQADLVAYCDTAAQEVQDQSGACTLVEATPTPTDSPIVGLPSTPAMTEPMLTSIPLEPSGEAQKQGTE
jgi:hypothetical protein